MITDSEFDSLAQRAHFLFGAIIPLFIADLMPDARVILVGSALFLLWASWKEFYYDERDEDPEHRGSGLRDFSFYSCGVGISLVLHFLKHPPS